MIDYSIENYIEKINSKNTKRYFKEVASSYYNENYRAAIVTLYSVVINDLIIKLQTLEEVYSDDTAKKILEEIKKYQYDNPYKSAWEHDIIEKLKERTNLFDNADYAHILALRNIRHLCAHPVIDKDDKLYTPNKETVSSHIRNMLESILIKPAILSKKILKTILIDIAEKKDILIKKETLEKYINSKYLKSLNKATEVLIFKELWKFVFKLEDEESKENRFINYIFLYILYNKNMRQCINLIKTETGYFSNILSSEGSIDLFIRFLSKNELLLKEFGEDVKLLISRRIGKYPNASIIAWFMSNSFSEHLEKVKELINEEKRLIHSPFEKIDNNKRILITAIERLIEAGVFNNHSKKVIEFIIWYYSSSISYNQADASFTSILLPNIELFEREDFLKLFEKTNENNQVYNRSRAEEDHGRLKQYILHKFEKEFPFSRYEKIFI